MNLSSTFRKRGWPSSGPGRQKGAMTMFTAVLILILLTVAAMVVGFVVFVTLGAVVGVVAMVRSLIAQMASGVGWRGDGRRNVRVIQR